MCRVSQLWLPDVSDSWWGLQQGMHVSSPGFGMVREGGEIGVQKRGRGEVSQEISNQIH